MDITPLVSESAQVIQRYGNRQFTVSGKVYNNNILVTPTQVVTWPHQPTVENLEIDMFNLILKSKEKVDIILLGCGKAIFPLPRLLRQQLKDRNINIDAMDTGAACRTYNILLSEGRKVAAALVAVE